MTSWVTTCGAGMVKSRIENRVLKLRLWLIFGAVLLVQKSLNSVEHANVLNSLREFLWAEKLRVQLTAYIRIAGNSPLIGGRKKSTHVYGSNFIKT